MNSKELAYAKQGALNAKSWDTFQKVIRISLKALRPRLIPNPKASFKSVLLVLFLFGLILGHTQQSRAMTRTLQKDPAIVLVAFGTTTNARVTYAFFEDQVRQALGPEMAHLKIAWAFTSEIVRERANKRFADAGDPQRYQSLAQTLANLENEGYRKIVLQSLHLFPGQEWDDMLLVIEAFEHLGLRIEHGGTLLHTWDQMFEAVATLEKDFLTPDQGSNIIVAHGTPKTAPGSNSTYLGLDRYLHSQYTNVAVGGIDGVLTRGQAIAWAKANNPKRVRLIPFMYVAGDHVMNDIMGSEPDKSGEISWAMELRAAGLSVDSLTIQHGNERLYKGLGFREPINDIFIHQIKESLKDLGLK